MEIDLASGKVTVMRRSSPIVRRSGVHVGSGSDRVSDRAAARRPMRFTIRRRTATFAGPAGEQPPLLVMIHGGPTSATAASFRLPIQYWTSRGFAVCDVNYGGSTGYGREYRNRLRDDWGVVDVADADERGAVSGRARARSTARSC